MKNLKEFKALILKYESITIKDLEAVKCDLRELTGFGSVHTCTLCESTPPCLAFPYDCLECVYGDWMGCLRGENSKTYLALRYSRGAARLKRAIDARAAHMRSILKKLNIEL